MEKCSCHERLEAYYDLKVFLTIDPVEQIQRIEKRNGSEKAVEFQKKWIPLEELIPCDLIVVAIGQGIETRYFEEHGVTVKRGTIEALDTSEIKDHKGIFAGGDCVTEIGRAHV